MLMVVPLLWLWGPLGTYTTYSMYNTDFASVGVCGCIVILYYLYHLCLIGLEAGRSRKFSWSDVVIRCNVTVSCICMLAYWVVKYQVWTITELYSTVVQYCTLKPVCVNLESLDWMVLLPRNVLLLCTSNIVYVLCVACIVKCTTPTNHTTSNHDILQLLYKLMHMIASFALLLGLMLGPMGCVCMVLYLLHTVVFVYCLVELVNTACTGISIDSKDKYTYKDDSKRAAATGTTISPATVTRLCTYIVYAAYFPIMGRFLYFVTGHRMDFGTLQVRILILSFLCVYVFIPYIMPMSYMFTLQNILIFTTSPFLSCGRASLAATHLTSTTPACVSLSIHSDLSYCTCCACMLPHCT